ncbi:MAG: HypC/HybG/HupF family hydrogenase formation chaperone [Armatimonadota bacterium]|nr:HypC/HybG/HupF family hydrogenase formation chaperone [Armatimonadota bacterium]
MCLAIPGQIVEIVDAEKAIAKADISGVKRNINIGLLDPEQAQVGHWVLIHVGFALSQIDEAEARETYELLRGLGPALDDEIEMMEQSAQLRSFEA